jgi:hypothetical protein
MERPRVGVAAAGRLTLEEVEVDLAGWVIFHFEVHLWKNERSDEMDACRHGKTDANVWRVVGVGERRAGRGRGRGARAEKGTRVIVDSMDILILIINGDSGEH